MNLKKYIPSIILLIFYILGQIYLIDISVSLFKWTFYIKSDTLEWLLFLLFFIFNYFLLSRVSDIGSVYLPKSHISVKSYLYFLIITLFSLFWSIHLIYETEVNKKVSKGEVYYNVKDMCLYHTKHLFEGLLHSATQASDQVTKKLFTASLYDLKSGKLKAFFTYSDEYYDEEVNKFKYEIRTYEIANGIVQIRYKRK